MGLDSEDKIRNMMPEFSTIIDLVQYYVLSSLQELNKLQIAQNTIPNNESKSFQNTKSKTLWVDCFGKLYQTIFLAYPLYKKDHPQSLSHLCRLSINNSIVSKISTISIWNLCLCLNCHLVYKNFSKNIRIFYKLCNITVVNQIFKCYNQT